MLVNQESQKSSMRFNINIAYMQRNALNPYVCFIGGFKSRSFSRSAVADFVVGLTYH